MAARPNLFAMNHELAWEDPDIFVVRVPYAHLGLGHTNCYIIRDGDEALVIDPGVVSPGASKALARAIDAVGVDLGAARFLCTHLHFDHAALLKEIAQPGSRILMSAMAYEYNPWNNYRARKKAVRELVRAEGITQMATRGLAALMSQARVCDLPGCTYTLLADGQEVRVGRHAFRVILTPGHAPGHICLYSDDERILLSGDHVLENTTPGLALPFEGHDSLRDYLASLAKVEGLDCRAVLPGHGEAFYDLAGRCAALREHHIERLGKVIEVVAHNPGANGNTIMRAMPWAKSGPFKNWERLNAYLRLNMGTQMLAYLEYLVRLGELERTEDGDGRHYWLA